MTKTIVSIIALTLLSIHSEVAAQSSSQKKPRRKVVHAAPASRWPPKSSSQLYKHTRAVAAFDRVEISRGGDDATGKFVAERTAVLTGSELSQFRSAWKQLDGGPGMGCWSPGYEVKFYQGEVLILTCQICFRCQIITFNTWANRDTFDASGPTGTALRSALEAAFTPVP